MFTNCGPATGAGSVSISTGSAASPPRRAPGVVPGGALPRMPGRGGHAGARVAPLPVSGWSAFRNTWRHLLTPTQLQDDGVVTALARGLRRGGASSSRTTGGKNNSSLDDALHSQCVHGKGTHIQRRTADPLNLRITEVHRE